MRSNGTNGFQDLSETEEVDISMFEGPVGTTGTMTRAIQTAVNDKIRRFGLSTPAPLGVDGQFGPLTHAATSFLLGVGGTAMENDEAEILEAVKDLEKPRSLYYWNPTDIGNVQKALGLTVNKKMDGKTRDALENALGVRWPNQKPVDVLASVGAKPTPTVPKTITKRTTTTKKVAPKEPIVEPKPVTPEPTPSFFQKHGKKLLIGGGILVLLIGYLKMRKSAGAPQRSIADMGDDEIQAMIDSGQIEEAP